MRWWTALGIWLVASIPNFILEAPAFRLLPALYHAWQHHHF